MYSSLSSLILSSLIYSFFGSALVEAFRTVKGVTLWNGTWLNKSYKSEYSKFLLESTNVAINK